MALSVVGLPYNCIKEAEIKLQPREEKAFWFFLRVKLRINTIQVI
jgi:hypothetical protein